MARKGGSMCGAAPLLDAFTAPQPDVDDDEEVGVGNELNDDSESEDDYCFD